MGKRIISIHVLTDYNSNISSNHYNVKPFVCKARLCLNTLRKNPENNKLSINVHFFPTHCWSILTKCFLMIKCSKNFTIMQFKKHFIFFVFLFYSFQYVQTQRHKSLSWSSGSEWHILNIVFSYSIHLIFCMFIICDSQFMYAIKLYNRVTQSFLRSISYWSSGHQGDLNWTYND